MIYTFIPTAKLVLYLYVLVIIRSFTFTFVITRLPVLTFVITREQSDRGDPDRLPHVSKKVMHKKVTIP